MLGLFDVAFEVYFSIIAHFSNAGCYIAFGENLEMELVFIWAEVLPQPFNCILFSSTNQAA